MLISINSVWSYNNTYLCIYTYISIQYLKFCLRCTTHVQFFAQPGHFILFIMCGSMAGQLDRLYCQYFFILEITQLLKVYVKLVYTIDCHTPRCITKVPAAFIPHQNGVMLLLQFSEVICKNMSHMRFQLKDVEQRMLLNVGS